MKTTSETLKQEKVSKSKNNKRISYLSLLTLLTLNATGALACAICEKQQPKILRGITHGTGPEGNFDYIIIWIMVAITMATLYFSVKWILRPGEKSDAHIKRFILNEQ